MLQRNDVCFFEWASELLMMASQMPKRCKIIARLHSFELYEWAPKIKWDAVDKIILVSKAMQQLFIGLYPEQSSKTEVIYNGRSLDLFCPPEQRNALLKIGMLGRISPVKRVYEVILMFYSVLQQGHNTELHLAGEPSNDYRYFVAIQRLIENLGLRDRVFFDGYRKDANVWLRNIDIYISNSYWEGQQVALLEAMASGCYCLSHTWAGAEEMLPENHLFTTEKELSDKVIEYIKMPECERTRNQIALRKLAVEKFDIEDTKRRIRHVIEVLSNHSGHNIS